jgi:O-antigen/teichoic acid export membrane protein
VKLGNRGFSEYLNYNIVNLVVGAVSIPVLTRLLSPSEYGFYVFAATVVTTVYGASLQWVQVAVSRFGFRGSTAAFPMRAFGGAFLAGLALAQTILVVVLFTQPSSVSWTTGLSLTLLLPLYALHVILAERLYVNHEPRKYQVAGNFHTLAKYAVGIALVWLLSPTAESMLWGWLIVLCLTTLVMLRWLDASEFAACRELSGFRKDVVTYSIPLSISNLLGTAGIWLPMFFLQATSGSAAVATYSIIAFVAHLLIFFIPSVFLMTSYPHLLSRHTEQQFSQVRSMMAYNVKATVLIASVGGIAFLLLGDLIIRFAAGPAYQADFATYSLVVLSTLLYATFRAIDPIYKLRLESRRILKVFAVGGGILLLGNVMWTTEYGVAGAFAAAASAYTVIVFLFLTDASRWGYFSLRAVWARNRDSDS